jgi:membrane-associated phospholipid phosphatase
VFSVPFSIDQAVSDAIQAFHPDWFTKLMHYTSLVFEPALLTGLCLLIAAVLYHRSRRDLAAKLIALSVGNILTPLLKGIFARQRPDASLVHVLIHESGFGFPSGHALGIVLFVASILVLTHENKRWWAWLVSVFLAGLVGFSRLVLGVHWLSDVLFGYLVAGLWVWAVVKFVWPHIHQWLTSPRR